MHRGNVSPVRSGGGGDGFADEQDAPVELNPKEIDLAHDGSDKTPNTLVVTVIQARNLQPATLRTTLSCYVKLSSLGFEVKTSVLSKTNEPYWHETFSFRALDWATSVVLSVRDKINVKMRFIGQARVSCAEVANLPGMQGQSWFRLRDKNWDLRPGAEAEIELKVALVYTKKNDPTIPQDANGQSAGDEVIGIAADQDDETEEETLARRRELERLEKERTNAVYANLLRGEYQLQVHVIEARDLKGENLSGTSDPYVLAEVCGQKKKTSTKYETLGCVFDEILSFNLKDMGRYELQRATLQLSIYDEERLLRDNLIGVYQLDCLSVYCQPRHELYRQWIAVYDPVSTKDVGIQGFLLVSVSIMGPGDVLPVHDRDAELAAELAQADLAAVEFGQPPAPGSEMALPLDSAASLVLLPPHIDLRIQFLVVQVLKAEDLPAMDAGSILTARGIDAFIQIGFGIAPSCQTSVVTVKGQGHLAPEFLEELWVPVMAPTLCRHVRVSAWDRDFGNKRDLVGIASYDYLLVAPSTVSGGLFAPMQSSSTDKGLAQTEDVEGEEEKNDTVEERVEFRWFNFYGPPMTHIHKKRANWVSEHPEFGSTYRGRVLMSLQRVEVPQPQEGEKFHVKRIPDSLGMLMPRFPKTTKYALRCALYAAADLPVIASFSTATAAKWNVRISVGPYEVAFDAQSANKQGQVQWEEIKEKWPIILPADLTQMPDVIVELGRQVDTTTFVGICFKRLATSALISRGFDAPPQWITLQEDVTRRQTKFALDKTQPPGVLLLRLAFGREEIAARHPWGDDLTLFEPYSQQRVYREIRVHLFQCRNLLPPRAGRIGPNSSGANLNTVDAATRLPNPMIVVRCASQAQKTQMQFKTLHPLVYETLTFFTQGPRDVRLMPDIVIDVLDASLSSSARKRVPNAVIGTIRVPMTNSVASVSNASPSRPSWMDLSSATHAISSMSTLWIDEPCGQILLSVQHVDRTEPPPIGAMGIKASEARAALRPEEQEVTVDVVALGVRHLRARSWLGLHRPFLEIELLGGRFTDGTSTHRTKPGTAAAGSRSNANFLERLVVPARVPVDPLFAPQLSLRVCDTSLGSWRRKVIAAHTVDLAQKLPWSADYRPTTTSVFENPKARAAVATEAQETKGQGSKLEMLGFKKKTKEFDPGSDNPVSESDEEQDDGMGIGDLSLPTIALYPARHGSSEGDRIADPALLQQVEQEEARRYAAARADMLRTGRSNISRAPLAQLSERLKDKLGGDGGPTSPKAATFMKGRDWWINQGGEELEQYLKETALESYPLYRWVLVRPSLWRRRRVRVQVPAGIFKGVLRVVEKRQQPGESKKKASTDAVIDLERLQEPQEIVVRVYVLHARNLQAKDANGFSDPYLRLQLGKETISDRSHHQSKTLNPDFFRVFSFHTTLPGPSLLEMEVWDHDKIMADEVIGRTVIDLEERWFHKRWQALGRESQHGQTPPAGLKPIERRHLMIDAHAQQSQGVLQLWVDMLTAQQAALVPAIELTPPTRKEYEIRVIIWRGENITDKDQSDINDYFVKVWMEGQGAETTDCHWRCSSGKPCWNWRFKLPVAYPLRSADLARLHVQLWDKDVLKWNDLIGDAQLDLFPWLRRAYETNRIISPFLELKERAKLNAGPNENKPEGSPNDSGEPDEEEEDEIGAEGDESRTNINSPSSGEKDALLGKQIGGSGKKKSGSKPTPTLADKRKLKQAREQHEAQEALHGLLDLMGLGSLPDDADWVPIYFTDREAGTSIDMGRLGISIQIVPQAEAEGNPVGKGREAPNVNPYLPPPVGRLRLSANPFLMFKELIGPKMCLRVTILACCLACIFCMGVFGSTIMSTLTFYEQMRASG